MAIIHLDVEAVEVGLLLSVYVKSVDDYIFIRSVCIKRNKADHRLLLDVAIQIYVDILIKDIAYATNLITSRSHDLIACFLTHGEITVNYGYNIRERRFHGRIVFLVCALLKHRAHAIVLYFYVYVLEGYIVDKTIASVLYIKRNVTASDKIASLKADISVFGRIGLNAYLAVHSPAAPHYAIFNMNIFDWVGVIIYRFYRDRIVEGADKAIFDIYVTCVGNINSVGIVSPMSYKLYVINIDAVAIKEGQDPSARICKDDVLDRYVLAIIETESSFGIRLVAILHYSFLGGVVYRAASVYADILATLGIKRAEHNRVFVNIHAIVIAKGYRSREMYSLSEIVGCALGVVSLGRFVEDVERVVLTCAFQDVALMLGESKFCNVSVHFHLYSL